MVTGLDILETASKKVIHKKGEFLGNKIPNTVTKSNDDKIEKQKPLEETIIPLEIKRWNIKWFETSVIITMKH